MPDHAQTNAAAGSPEPVKTRVFLSYSRKDAAFVARLSQALETRGYEPDYDQSHADPANIDTGISAQDEWWQRLEEMITRADVIIFIVSPDSAASKVCDEEIVYARTLHKRIIPILQRPIDFANSPPRLSALNVKLDFVADQAFSSALDQLCAALNLDIAWCRESRRLTGLALEWESQGRPVDRIMSPADIKAVQRLLESRPRNADRPPQVLTEFLNASREHQEKEALRINHMRVALGLLMIGIIVALIGWINQSSLIAEWNWFSKMRPYMNASVRPFVLTATAERALRPLASFRECAKDCPVMIVLPTGSYMMGSPDSENGHEPSESPQVSVTIARPLAVSKYPVTFDDWDTCVSVGGCTRNSESEFGRGQMPVINVSWDEAKRYVAWLSLMTGKPYRLLSEAEWEYAARAGSTTAYPWGDDVGNGNANCKRCGSKWDGKQTSPVGSFKPNAFGLFDMQGNVFQWVEDCYQGTLSGATTDGSALLRPSCKRRVVRGGSWYDSPDYLRSANRSRGDPSDSRDDELGFRIARTLTP